MLSLGSADYSVAGIGTRVEVLVMKMRDVGLFLLGSALVYVAMAACSGGAGSGNATKSLGSGGSIAAAGAGGTGSGHDGGLIDALMDPVPSVSADPVSGQRLKAQYRVADDGSKEYLPGLWFDTQRSEGCAFTLASDGKSRCLPDGSAVQVYSDAACTTAIVATATGCTTPTYALTSDDATCGPTAGGLHIFSVAAAANPSSLYVKSGSMCYQAGAASSGFNYYGVGTEIAADSFVAASTLHD